MTKKVESATAGSGQPELVRSYYRIDEHESIGLSAETLLDLAACGKLTLSIALPGRCLLSGQYIEGEGGDECVETEGMTTGLGLTPLLKEYVWQIIAAGRATIEYTYKSEDEFARIDYSESNPLPIVGREYVLITKRDLDLYRNGMPAEPKQPSSTQGHVVAKALACLYAVEAGHRDENGQIKLSSLLSEIQDKIQDETGDLPYGLRKATFYETMKGIDKIARCIDDLKQYY